MFDFEDARSSVEAALASDEFRAVQIQGPPLCGKTKLVRQLLLLTQREKALVVYLDFKLALQLSDVVRHLILNSDYDEFEAIRRQLAARINSSVSFDRSRISNSQITVNPGLSDQQMLDMVAQCLRQDLRKLRRRLVFVLDHTHNCPTGTVGLIDIIIRTMRSIDAGLLISTRQTNDSEATDQILRAIPDFPFSLDCCEDRLLEVRLPSFVPSEILDFAQFLSVDPTTVDEYAIYRFSRGLPGMVSQMLINQKAVGLVVEVPTRD